MKPRLYVIALSHPSYAARLMVDHKGLDARVVHLLNGFHPLVVRALGFPRGTVPALRIDRRRVQGSLQISRALDELVPGPPLFPADVEERRRVEAAEAWGEGELQPVPRRLYRWALNRHRRVRRDLAELIGLPAPGLMAPLMKPLAACFAREGDDATVQADLRRLPALLDHVDALIGEGVIGGSPPSAADFQIAPSVRLLLAFDDLAAGIRRRPAAGLALSLLPEYPGRVPPALPREWLPPGS